MYAAIDTWIRRVDRTNPPLRLIDANGQERTRGHFSIIMNATPYTFLGTRAFELVPELTLQDPLAAVTLEELNLRTLGPVAAAALAHRPMEGRKNLDIATGVRSLVIESDPPSPYQVDGDHLGASKRLRFTWTPNHLSLLVPLR